MRRPSGIPANLDAQAVSLTETLGLAEDAWPFNTARELIASLEGRPVIILGGDILRRLEDRFDHTYDS
jgi:hypothetical protein